jgi:hypothetical protein
VQALSLDLYVRSASAVFALLEPNGRDLALLGIAERLGDNSARKRRALGQAPSNAVRDVVLLAAEKVENRANRSAVQREVGHAPTLRQDSRCSQARWATHLEPTKDPAASTRGR